MALFNFSERDDRPDASLLGALQGGGQQPKRGGLMGALSDPRMQAMLAGMSQRFLEAGAPSLTPKASGLGATLGAGLMGANEGMQSYAAQQAAQVAAALDRRMKEAEIAKAEMEVSGGAAPWTTDLGRQVSLYAGQLKSQDHELTDEQAQFIALEQINARQLDMIGARSEAQARLEGVRDYYARLREGRSVGLAGQTAEASTAARLEAERAGQKEEKLVKGQDVVLLLDEATAALGSASSGGLASGLTALGEFIGLGTESGASDAQLKSLEGQIIAAQPRVLGINPTDADVRLYKQMAGDIANPMLSTDTRMKAIEGIRRLTQRYAERAGVKPEGKPARRIRIDAQGNIQ
jgi:hypothetical protein